MKLYNYRRVYVGEYERLSDGTYQVTLNDDTRLKDYKINSYEELDESLKNRDLIKEIDLGQLNIFDF